jgi:hypothetical protein
MRQIEWDVAEVLSYDYTYQYIPSGSADTTTNKLFALKVRSCSTYYNDKTYLAKPANINLKQIPLVGEFVIVYKTFNEQATSDKWRETWYYVSSIDVQSATNENLLPGLSNGLDENEIANIKPGKTFVRQTISPLQAYEGDYLLEGRNGNSIRFGSTISTNYPTNYYTKPPKWFTPGLTSGDPIIILSNGRKNLPNKEFVVEDIETDASSLYLTSTQTIDNLKYSRELSGYPYSLNGSHLIGVADRVILRAKTDIAVIDAEEGIVLNTPGKVRIGASDATQPLTYGNKLKDILEDIVQVLAQGTIGPGGPGTPVAKAKISEIAGKLGGLNSTKYFIKEEL